MEALPAEELAGEKVKYTLDLKGKKVKETELVARADKVRREIGAEVVGGEQIIAAKAQEEAMKHLLPFEQRQSKPWRGSRCGSLRRHRHDGRAVRATRSGVARTGFDVLGNTHDGERDHEPGDKHDDKRDDERHAEQGRHCTGRASRGRGPLRRGVAFASFEREGAMRICYEGEAFRRVLAMLAADAALGPTRPECIDPALPVTVRQQFETWRAEVRDRVDIAALCTMDRPPIRPRPVPSCAGRTRAGKARR